MFSPNKNCWNFSI